MLVSITCQQDKAAYTQHSHQRHSGKNYKQTYLLNIAYQLVALLKHQPGNYEDKYGNYRNQQSR